MKFSIIIPSYGQAKYLEDAIESALSQNFDPKEFEVIVVDDGSTDGSLEIASRYEPRIKLIRQINKGLASARNTALMNASGIFIVPLDADDELMPLALKRIHDAAWEGFEYSSGGVYTKDIIGISLRCCDEQGNCTDTILLPNPKFGDFKEGNRMAYCAAIKRSILLKVGGYSPRYDALGGWEDLALWYDLLCRGYEITTLKEPLLMYRVKENSMWKEAEKNKEKLWTQIVKDFPEAKDHAKS